MSLRHPVDSWLLVSRSSGYITNDSVCLIWRMPQCVIYDSWLPVSYNRLMASCVVYDSSLLVSHMTHGSLYTWLMTRWCLIDRLIASCVVYDSWLVGVLYIDLSLRVSFMTHGSLCVTWLMSPCVLYDSWFLVCYMTHGSSHESCASYERVMSHIKMSHVTHMNKPYHEIPTAQRAWYGVATIRRCVWREQIMCTCGVMSHIWMSHVAHMNESCHELLTAQRVW